MKSKNSQFEHSRGQVHFSAREMSGARRGNTIVLVTGILVLLVIIATAYVTRTQSARYTAIATTNSNLRDDVNRAIADMLAEEVKIALFVRNTSGTSSNAWRDLPNPNAARYGIDLQFDPATGNLLFPFNFAPYHVVPWTNWPDNALNGGPIAVGSEVFWPKGTGNPSGGGNTPFQQAVLANEDNPFGNPGFGDTRWLRDLEPLRWDSNLDGLLDAYSHWRHMTNIARADNAFRIVFDISDIGDSDNDGYGRIVTDLSIPVEQFLTMNHGYLNSVTGDTDIFANGQTAADFVDRWRNWLGIANDLAGYQNALTNPLQVPPNLVRLSDLNANGTWHEAGERPEDEFIRDSSRWFVSKILCDTDGDGYTDSFWFLAPTSVASGIRTIVGVSIIDNCGMVNANVATRFLRNNFDFTGITNRKTRGHTPSDIALAADLQFNYQNGNWNVGFLDNWDHWFTLAADPDAIYDMTSWVNHVNEVGMYTLGGAGVPPWPDMFLRLDYWRNSASRPLSVVPFSRYTPFTLGDEIELRMFAGNNYPWAVTRFERSTEGTNNDFRLLRSGIEREESSEYLDQLSNRELIRDLRKRLTLYSAVRNDLMPPWTWRFDRSRQPFAGLGGIEDLNGDGNVDALDVELFAAGMRKFDLRTSFEANILGPFGPNGAPGFASIVHTGNALDPQSIDYNAKFGVALRDHLERCLIDSQPVTPGTEGSYYGSSADDVGKTRDLSAAFAANITQWRDADSVVSLDEAVPVSDNPNTRFLGMEPQPFLVEVFIGHVYKPYIVPPTDVLGDPYTDVGNYLLLDPGAPGSNRSTIVVVQIANPYDVPIDLSDYKISVFGQDLLLSDAVVYDHTSPGSPSVQAPTILEPATAERPTTAIYYSIHSDLINSPQLSSGDTKWLNFLDLDRGPAPFPNDHPNTTIIASPGNGQWSMDRDVYDTFDPERAVELSRRDPNPANPVPAWVVVDRIDRPQDYNPSDPNALHFGQRVNAMGQPGQRPWPVPAGGLNSVLVGDPAGMPWVEAYGIPPNPGAANGVDARLDIAMGPPSLGYDQWVQFVRATRAWAADLNLNNRYDPNEQNPRFIFADKALVTPVPPQVTPGSTYSYNYLTDGDSHMGPGRGGYRYKFTRNPDADPLTVILNPNGPVTDLPWFTRRYYNRLNQLSADPQIYDPAVHAFPRKPTFFDMNNQDDPASANNDPAYPSGSRSFPDKGWYSQRGGVDNYFIDPSNGNILALLKYPMQMLHKNADFEQVGELLNIWMYGHKINWAAGGPGSGAGVATPVTETTFSEFLRQESLNGNEVPLVGKDFRVNRIRLVHDNSQGTNGGQVIGVGPASDPTDVRHSIPDLPAAARLLDAFVCDGYGIDPVTNLDLDPSGQITAADQALRDTMIFFNAKNFDGTGTHGMLNANTASYEALRALPHWYRLVHETGRRRMWNDSGQLDSGPVLFNFIYNSLLSSSAPPLVTDGNDPDAVLPRTMAAEALWQYRERFNGFTQLVGNPLNPTGVPFGANYEARASGVRGDRGIASIGELGLLINPGQGIDYSSISPYEPPYFDRPSAGIPDRVYDQQWRIDLGLQPTYLALDSGDPMRAKPMWGVYPNASNQFYQSSIRISTDRVDAYDPFNSTFDPSNPGSNIILQRPDSVAGDVEEANALLAGVSNLITTRSDTFTVYFRVRSFRQNTSVDPPIWDATNPEYIVDDSRYVMLVDRSSVNKPGEKPRILYLEKLPN